MTENYDYCIECRKAIRIGLDEENNDYAVCEKCLKRVDELKELMKEKLEMIKNGNKRKNT